MTSDEIVEKAEAAALAEWDSRTVMGTVASPEEHSAAIARAVLDAICEDYILTPRSDDALTKRAEDIATAIENRSNTDMEIWVERAYLDAADIAREFGQQKEAK